MADDFDLPTVPADVELTETVDADSPQGPAHIALLDPDGNSVLIDQFF